jgi:hypothetical protein
MTLPEMISVDSSNIEHVGYDETAQDLYVQFHSGQTYVYSGVSPYTFDELLNASSKGSYLNREIKPNYECRLL